MKKSLIFLFLIILFLSSCITERACNKKFPPEIYSIAVDSTIIKDSIVYSYAEIPIYIKGDTVTKYDTVTINKKTGLVNSKPVYAETEFAKAIAQVVNSNINLSLFQKDSIFVVKTDSLVKEVYHWKEKYNKISTQTIKEVKVIPKSYSIFALIGLIFVIGTILYFIFKLKDKLHVGWPR